MSKVKLRFICGIAIVIIVISSTFFINTIVNYNYPVYESGQLDDGTTWIKTSDYPENHHKMLIKRSATFSLPVIFVAILILIYCFYYWRKTKTIKN